MALTLALSLLLLKAGRVLADEDDVGYRKSYYKEDDGRMSVTTDVWQFNVGLHDNIRVNGDVVFDAISGATPDGAPPQSKWPFQTFSSLYQSDYQVTYNNQFNQYVNNNLPYVSAGLISSQDLTNGATTFAQQTAGAIATNNANASYQTLTNNPNYRNTKVPVTHLHDYRNAFSINLPMTFGRQQITPSIAYSKESDYVSYGASLNYAVDFNQKNTTLTMGFSHDDDTVRDDTLVTWRPKKTDDLFVGLVQLFGPKAYLTVNASMSFERGYLADPYRGVMLESELQNDPNDPALSKEVRPRHRDSQILYSSWNQFITPLNGGYEFSYRLFHDSYGILANTAEIDWHQKIGKHLVISPMFRYYVQNAAEFYYTLVPDANGLPAFYSSDYRLSEMETFATGVNISWRIQKHFSIDVSYMRYIMRGLDGETSQSAYPSANVISIGARIWF
jgi:hypothetical protein